MQEGEITIPARKLFDIVRALPDGARIELKLNGDRIALNAGRSRFTLATLPATEFPTIYEIELVERVSLPEEVLRDLMEHTSFAMANQDVRYYTTTLRPPGGDVTNPARVATLSGYGYTVPRNYNLTVTLRY